MEFNEFVEKVTGEFKKIMPQGRAEPHTVKRNNGMEYKGILVPGTRRDISPVIPLEGFYEELCTGKGFGDVMEEIMETYGKLKDGIPIQLPEIRRWELAKNRVAPKLVSWQENREMLKDMPHERFLNLAVVYIYIAGTWEGGFASAAVTKDMLKAWGTCREELRAYASVNFKNYFTADVRSLEELLEEFHYPAGKAAGGLPCPLYIMTNQEKVNGAAFMLFPEELEKAAEKLGSDFYILPSSIHEILLMPCGFGTPEELKQIVCAVNRSEVPEELRLSDSVYCYSREEGCVCIAAE